MAVMTRVIEKSQDLTSKVGLGSRWQMEGFELLLMKPTILETQEVENWKKVGYIERKAAAEEVVDQKIGADGSYTFKRKGIGRYQQINCKMVSKLVAGLIYSATKTSFQC